MRGLVSFLVSLTVGIGWVGPVRAADLTMEDLVYVEDFSGESNLPTTPELDLRGLGGLTELFLGNAPTFTPLMVDGTAGTVTFDAETHSGPQPGEIMLLFNVAAEAFPEPANVRVSGTFENFDPLFTGNGASQFGVWTADYPTSLISLGAAFIYPCSSTGSCLHVFEQVYGVASHRLFVDVPPAVVSAILAGAQTHLEVLVDRRAATVSASMTVDGTEVSTPPLTLVGGLLGSDTLGVVGAFGEVLNSASIPYPGYDFTADGDDRMTVELLDLRAASSPPLSANAGPDQTIDEGTTVFLDGTASTVPIPGDISYLWTQVAGTAVTLSDPTDAQPSFASPLVPPSPGSETLTFKLEVSSGGFVSDPDFVNVGVVNVNTPPTADPGDPQIVQEGSPVELDGTGSFDGDADPLSFSWLQIAGTPVVLASPLTPMPTFTAPLVGPAGDVLEFELTVTDVPVGDFDSATVLVEVVNVNQPPIANAGADQTADEITPVQLNGSGSDPDSDPLTFTWVQTEGTPVLLSDPTAANPTFTAPAVPPGGEDVVLELTVSDGDLDSDPDSVTIHVLNTNDPPACDLAAASPDRLWPPNHRLEAIEIVGVTDPDADEVTIAVTGVTQDEPIDGIGSGDTAPDALIDGTVLLRVERTGTGNGRVYGVSFQADDGAGGTCTGNVTVCVPYSKRALDCPDDGQLYDSLSE